MQSKHARVCLQRKGSHAARAECAQNFQRVVFLRARAEESAAKQARAAALLLVKLVQNVQLKAPKEKKTVKKKNAAADHYDTLRCAKGLAAPSRERARGHV